MLHYHSDKHSHITGCHLISWLNECKCIRVVILITLTLCTIKPLPIQIILIISQVFVLVLDVFFTYIFWHMFYDIILIKYWFKKMVKLALWQWVFFCCLFIQDTYMTTSRNNTTSTNKAANCQKHVQYCVVPIRPYCGSMGGITWRQKWSWPTTGHHLGI